MLEFVKELADAYTMMEVLKKYDLPLLQVCAIRPCRKGRSHSHDLAGVQFNKQPLDAGQQACPHQLLPPAYSS